MLLSWGFSTWSGRCQLDRETLPLTVADPCIWHSSGTNLSQRQSATTAGAPTDHARVPHRTTSGLRMLLPTTRASCDGQRVLTAPEPVNLTRP